MCGRYSVLTEDEIVEVRQIIKDISLELANDALSETQANQKEVYPTNAAPVITATGGNLTFEYASFGFLRWDGKGVIINARSETVKEKSMFKNHIHTGRCVIPASGYFEWKNVDKKTKHKHLLKDRDGNLLFMAGLYRDGTKGREFVIITKNPYGEVTTIHDRMPVILHTDKLESWLDGTMPIDALASIEYEVIMESCDESDFEQLTLG